MKTIIICFVFSCLTVPLFAETIVLKSGEIIEGTIIEKTDTAIKVQVLDDFAATYFLDDVKSIEGEPLASQKQETPTTTQEETGILPDKKELLEKIRSARKQRTRTRAYETVETDIEDIMHVKYNRTVDIDVPKRILSAVTETTEFEVQFTDDLFSSVTEQAITKAKEKGATPQQIDQMRQRTAALLPRMKQAMQSAIEQVKMIKPRILLTEDAMYLNMVDRWYTIATGSLNDFWQMLEKARSGDRSGVQGGLAFLENTLPESQKQVVAGISQNLFSWQDSEENLLSVQESEFAGKPVYALQWKVDDAFKKLLRDAIVASVKTPGQQENEVSADTIVLKQFVSKEDYQLLATTLTVEISLANYMGRSRVKGYVDDQTIYQQLHDDIVVPKEAQQASVIKDAAEMSRVLLEEMRGSMLPQPPAQ